MYHLVHLPSLFALLAAICMPLAALAQTPDYRISDTNHHVWLMYFGDHKLTDTWGLHTEVQVRRADLLNKSQQLLWRAGINYSLPNGMLLTSGYALAKSSPYGDYPAKTASKEHRIYEQLQLTQPLGRVQLMHRYRLEQRWTQAAGSTTSLYFNRARYLLKATLPLAGPTLEPNELYLSAYDEIFIGFGKNVHRNVFDQNRASFVLGYKFSPAAALEIGYLHQLVQQRAPLSTGETVVENNHTLQAGFIYNLDFRRKETPALPTPAAP
ncbi:DUF2490 domain-containing protein [Hymenobacter sp. BT730]|uniref:DUF2490 domain-containing protein n=1 Tax=Hymenobacter sp. BT730 TaxID=3063332 RepID=UPI0026DFB2A8|nr:DUF2490 domain-containing protein [Hymenobacter sp. BT730]